MAYSKKVEYIPVAGWAAVKLVHVTEQSYDVAGVKIPVEGNVKAVLGLQESAGKPIYYDYANGKVMCPTASGTLSYDAVVLIH